MVNDMTEKTAKEIGETIISNPRMIIWNYYEPFEKVYERIRESAKIAESIYEIQIKVIGVTAMAYFYNLITAKEVLIICNKIDESVKQFQKEDLDFIFKNFRMLLEMYKSLDSIALMANRTTTAEDFRQLMDEEAKNHKMRKIRKQMKEYSDADLWDAYSDIKKNYMDAFRRKYILPAQSDVRFHRSPYEDVIESVAVKLDKKISNELKNEIISILNMPKEAEQYYENKLNMLEDALDNTSDMFENRLAEMDNTRIFNNAAKKKLQMEFSTSEDDASIISYIVAGIETTEYGKQ